MSQSRPDGISTARMGLFSWFIIFMRFWWGVRNWPMRPVPKRASIIISLSAVKEFTTSFRLSWFISMVWILWFIFFRMSRFVFASPFIFSGLPKIAVLTLKPLFIRCLAMTKPSPPLFPVPQRMETFGFGLSMRSCIMSSAQERPAFSIRTVSGIPMVFIAHASKLRTSSRVMILKSLSGSYLSICFDYKQLSGEVN